MRDDRKTTKSVSFKSVSFKSLHFTFKSLHFSALHSNRILQFEEQEENNRHKAWLNYLWIALLHLFWKLAQIFVYKKLFWRMAYSLDNKQILIDHHTAFYYYKECFKRPTLSVSFGPHIIYVVLKALVKMHYVHS